MDSRPGVTVVAELRWNTAPDLRKGGPASKTDMHFKEILLPGRSFVLFFGIYYLCTPCPRNLAQLAPAIHHRAVMNDISGADGATDLSRVSRLLCSSLVGPTLFMWLALVLTVGLIVGVCVPVGAPWHDGVEISWGRMECGSGNEVNYYYEEVAAVPSISCLAA